MRVISKKKLRDFYIDNTQAKLPLTEWYYKMEACKAKNLSELKKNFNGVDFAHGYTLFDIGGNNYRLITAIHYNTERCYVRVCWTHAEYSKKVNQDKIGRGQL